MTALRVIATIILAVVFVVSLLGGILIQYNVANQARDRGRISLWTAYKEAYASSFSDDLTSPEGSQLARRLPWFGLTAVVSGAALFALW